MNNIYRENILEHYKNPLNHEEMADATVDFEDTNPVCGDEIHFWVKIDDDGKIKRATFKGRGCAISQASASMLTETVEGMTVEEVEELGADEIRELLGVPLSPIRLKCALLGLKVLQGALLKYKGEQVNKR